MGIVILHWGEKLLRRLKITDAFGEFHTDIIYAYGRVNYNIAFSFLFWLFETGRAPIQP
jgi:hypothetical protein